MKKSINKKTMVIIVSLLIIIVAILGAFFVAKNKVIYKAENRTKELNAAKKNFEDEVLGWIRVQGTNIDLPIIKNTKKTNLAGIEKDFAWVNLTPEKTDTRIVIEGHNILNVSNKPLVNDKSLSRFEQLMGYIYPTFVKENKYIEYNDGKETHLYAIYGVSFQDYLDVKPFYFDLSKKERKEYIKEAKKDSYFNFNIAVSEEDELITLVTCTRMFGEDQSQVFKVEGRKLRKNEKAINYGFDVKESYKKIEKIMEGDEGNGKV